MKIFAPAEPRRMPGPGRRPSRLASRAPQDDGRSLVPAASNKSERPEPIGALREGAVTRRAEIERLRDRAGGADDDLLEVGAAVGLQIPIAAAEPEAEPVGDLI